MKKVFNLLIVGGASLAMSVTAISFSHLKVKKADAYDTSSLPTTINLNDCTDEEVRNYYSALNSLDENERKGTNLLKNLKPILKNGQKYYSYDTDNSGRKIWQIYEIADRDWAKSPASEISGYDSATNTITGYSYGTSATKSGTNPYIHALYVNRSVDNNVRAWAQTDTTTSSHGDNKEWCIDREHIWPKSQGFDNTSEGVGGARGDPMHLWPGDSDVNSSIHSNNYYGYVVSETKHGKWSYATKNLLGKALNAGDTVDVFEPQDCDKGDIARAIFYMVARYNYLSGSDSDGIDTNNPNLSLSQDLGDWASTGYTSSTTTTGKMGILTDLLAWHHADPVDEFEIHRNNLLYRNYTNNRNPFIDFPDWVDAIWGVPEYEGRQLGMYDPTPTRSANPQTDKIAKAALSISDVSVELKVGEKKEISAATTDNSTITWEVSDSSVISVSKTTSESGEKVTVTALKEGKATVTAKATVESEDYSRQCGFIITDDSAGNNDDTNNKKKTNIFLIIGIIVAVIVVVVILVIVFVNMNKKGKKKMIKTTKKIVKTATKSSKKKK